MSTAIFRGAGKIEETGYKIYFNSHGTQVVGASSVERAEAVVQSVLARCQIPLDQRECLETALKEHRVHPKSMEESRASQQEGAAIAAKCLNDLRKASEAIRAEERDRLVAVERGRCCEGCFLQ